MKRAGRTFTHALTLSRRTPIDAFSSEVILEIPQADRNDPDEALAIEGRIVCNQVARAGDLELSDDETDRIDRAFPRGAKPDSLPMT
jgi:hypothetical protein